MKRFFLNRRFAFSSASISAVVAAAFLMSACDQGRNASDRSRNTQQPGSAASSRPDSTAGGSNNQPGTSGSSSDSSS
jgi:hypothetical protein